MTFRNSCRDPYPGPDIDGRGSAEALRGWFFPLFTVSIGLLAGMNVASVVFVLLE
jgi:hypothetical protein